MPIRFRCVCARDREGRPLNPLGRTGLGGRGLLGRWGRNEAADALLTRLQPETGRLQVLIIERRDKQLPSLQDYLTSRAQQDDTTDTGDL